MTASMWDEMIAIMATTPPPPGGSKVRLLVEHTGQGRPVHEVLPARDLGEGLFELAGSPGLVLGCAAGDTLWVADDGAFEVTQQGRMLCVQAVRPGDTFNSAAVTALAAAVESLGGLVEAPSDRRFIVVTVDRSAGVQEIERVMDAWAGGVGQAQWWFGNAEAL